MAQHACVYYQIRFNRDLNHCLLLCEQLSSAEKPMPKLFSIKLTLARLLLQDKDYAKNEEKALEILGFDGIYKGAAKQNHGLAQYACIRYQLQSNRDLGDCLNFCEQLAAAKSGNGFGFYYCAHMLAEGRGVVLELSLTCQYYEKCSEHYFEAKLRLACLLLECRIFGVPNL